MGGAQVQLLVLGQSRQSLRGWQSGVLSPFSTSSDGNFFVTQVATGILGRREFWQRISRLCMLFRLPFRVGAATPALAVLYTGYVS